MGLFEEQDLRDVRTRLENPSIGWSGLSDEEKEAWSHWRMLGEGSANPDDSMKIGDIVLVPNMPDNSFFALYRLTGPYEFAIDPTIEDLGHVRQVEVLTPDGFAYSHPLVTAELRRSLRCRSQSPA